MVVLIINQAVPIIEKVIVVYGWLSKVMCRNYCPDYWELPNSEGNFDLASLNNRAIRICWLECLVRQECEDYGHRISARGMIYGGKRFNHETHKKLDNQVECQVCGKFFVPYLTFEDQCSNNCLKIARKLKGRLLAESCA